MNAGRILQRVADYLIRARLARGSIDLEDAMLLHSRERAAAAYRDFERAEELRPAA